MAIENFLRYEIKKTLCELPEKPFGYYKPAANIQKYLVEYVFGNSRVIFPGFYSKGPFNLISFTSLAESENFVNLVRNDRRILSLTKEIKDIYLNRIINNNYLSVSELIENHMKPLIRILFDPYLSSEEFYTRAKSLKENLLISRKTYVPERTLFPNFHKEQEQYFIKKKKVYEYSMPNYQMRMAA